MVIHKKQCFLGLSILLILIFINSSYKIDGPATEIPSIDKFEQYFHLNGSQELFIKRKHVQNEAIVQINCQLFANSTSNITLVIKPESEWNVSHIMVGVGQNITAIVTNGVILTSPSDVALALDLWIHLEPDEAEVWGKIIVVIITRGWEPISWFLIPSFLSLLLFVVIRSWKRRKK